MFKEDMVIKDDTSGAYFKVVGFGSSGRRTTVIFINLKTKQKHVNLAYDMEGWYSVVPQSVILIKELS